MIKRLVCSGILAIAAPLGAQTTVDTSGAGAIISQAMDHSEVMKNLEYLTDVIGHSSAVARAGR